MDNAFARASTASNPHRKLKDSKAHRFSPSYGVHKGLIRDPNWPPTEFPAEGNAAMRRNRRILCELSVTIDGQTHAVKGDLSKGGAMFMLPIRSETRMVTIAFASVQARAMVLTTSKKDGQVAHHSRFVDPGEGLAVWAQLIRT